MVKIKAFFEHEGISYNYWLNPIGIEAIPTVFQVFDEKYYYLGSLILMVDGWHFDDNPAIESILGNIIELWYQ